MNILSKLLEFRGIKDFSELSQEERQQFTEWQHILEKDEIGGKEIAEFCEAALKTIEQRFEEEVSQAKLQSLTTQHTVYRKLRDLVQAPTHSAKHLWNT